MINDRDKCGNCKHWDAGMPNFLTESEAKTKWCPLARASSATDGHGTVANRTHDFRVLGGVPDSDCMCIASACMAWRSETVPANNEDRPEELLALGYCGAFGRPA